jgi:hypothetical protein
VASELMEPLTEFDWHEALRQNPDVPRDDAPPAIVVEVEVTELLEMLETLDDLDVL